MKFARVGPRAPRARALVLSRQRGAVLDDAAADAARRARDHLHRAAADRRRGRCSTPTFAALRRSGGAFGRADRLTPADVFAAQGSRVAFQPLTGEPVVAVPFLVGRTVAVGRRRRTAGRAPPAAP